MKREQAEAIVAALVAMRESAGDALASCHAAVYPTLKGNGELVKAGTRINWNGSIRRAAVDLWDTAENSPEKAADLWEEIPYRNGVRVIPAAITAGQAFSKGERGWWGEELYESILEGANTWTPADYPEAWAKVED